MYSSKHSFRAIHHTYKGEQGAGILSAIGSLGGLYTAYKGVQGLKSVGNWIGQKYTNAANYIKGSATYNKVANTLAPNRGFPTVAASNLGPGEKAATSVVNNERKYNLDVKGFEKPVFNSDPFNKYELDTHTPGGFKVVGKTPLGEKILKSNFGLEQTDPLKQGYTEQQTSRLIGDRQFHYKPGLTGDAADNVAKASSTNLMKSFNKFDVAQMKKSGVKSPAQLLLDRFGKGISDVNRKRKMENETILVKKAKNGV